MGSVLTPLMVGLDASFDLPNACTLNGRCNQVCPMDIPLPDLLRKLRMRGYEEGLVPARVRAGLKLWAFFAMRPRLYHAAARLGIGLLGRMGTKRGRFRRLPFAGAWTDARDFPAPQGETFQSAWKARGKPR
jgi:L-lactate dehydrogenase complex protein LldF